jgi:trans-aconitate 2-methyltransferase
MLKKETPPSSDWNPELYVKFERERTLAARDLLSRTPIQMARTIYDLGCGPGNTVELLLQRFPESSIVGLDTSEAMLVHGRRRAPTAAFLKQDISDWIPPTPVDLIFANAVLHFLPNHHELIPRLASFLTPGGYLAIQMPNNTREASHAAMRLVASEGPWADRLVPVAKTRPVIAEFDIYYDGLSPLCVDIEIWITTYIHVLNGSGEIVDWFAGSALQPFLSPLTDGERVQFLQRYRSELALAYPTREDGKTFLAYPRLFIVARSA